jgi:hypothetical protein
MNSQLAHQILPVSAALKRIAAAKSIGLAAKSFAKNDSASGMS